jgi:hypothetical protein
MRKTTLLLICFFILGILFLSGCQIIEEQPWPTPTPIPPYGVGIFGESRFGQAVFGTEESKPIIKNFKKEK